MKMKFYLLAVALTAVVAVLVGFVDTTVLVKVLTSTGFFGLFVTASAVRLVDKALVDLIHLNERLSYLLYGIDEAEALLKAEVVREAA
jgi:hypothetical protein